MLASFLKDFIYIKSKKTAGSSMEVYLQRWCCPEYQTWSDLDKNHPMRISKYGIIGGRGTERAKKYAIFASHQPISDIREKIDHVFFNKCLKITSTRNIYDRMISAFYHEHDKRKMTDHIEGFRNWLSHNAIKNYSLKPFICIDDKEVVNFYIRFEHLLKDLENLCLKLDMEFEPNIMKKIQIHKGSRQKGIPIKKYYNKRTIDLLHKNEYSAWEIKRFGYRLK